MFMLSKMHALLVGGGYRAEAVNFNGSSSQATITSFSGQADSFTAIFHCFFKTPALGSGSTSPVILSGHDGGGTALIFIGAQYQSGDTGLFVRFRLTNGFSLEWSSTGLQLGGNGWHSLSIAVNSNVAHPSKIFLAYVDDVANGSLSGSTGTASTMDFTPSAWVVGNIPPSANFRWDGDLAQLYFAPGQFLDFTNAANRRKFVDGSNKPVDLGLTGSLPTGSQPLLLLQNPAATYGTNSGSGGNLTASNITAATTSPSG